MGLPGDDVARLAAGMQRRDVAVDVVARERPRFSHPAVGGREDVRVSLGRDDPAQALYLSC
jgi:hypothetical protein